MTVTEVARSNLLKELVNELGLMHNKRMVIFMCYLCGSFHTWENASDMLMKFVSFVYPLDN